MTQERYPVIGRTVLYLCTGKKIVNQSVSYFSPQISTTDMTHARTEPDTQRAQAHSHTQTTPINGRHSQLFHGPTPRSPLHRLSIRLRRSRSITSTEYSLPGATQLKRHRGEPRSTRRGPSIGIAVIDAGRWPARHRSDRTIRDKHATWNLVTLHGGAQARMV